jgi:hypothetical protein
MPDFISPSGAIFGPNFVIVTVEQSGVEYQLQVYPDANNQALQAAGLATYYYWQPAQLYVATEPDNPAVYDFGMTLFKGLLTSDRDIGVTSADQEMGGGWLTFSTTFAVPDEVITAAISQLQSHTYSTPDPTIAGYFNYRDGDPTPNLGLISITEDDVTINIPDLTKATPGMWIEATSPKKGSIEAQGINSFLVTCNQWAAGAIASGLAAGGAPPFTVECDLHEQFWVDACTVTVTADADKVYDSVSAAVSEDGFLGICSASLQAAYMSMQTSGVIQTTIQMNSGALTPAQQTWIQQYVDNVQAEFWDAAKSEIFDWDPTKSDPTGTASASQGFFSSLFGGASVSLKADYQRQGLTLTAQLTIEGVISATQGVSGDFTALMAAVKAHLSTYLAVVDIGQYFEKVQVAATSAVQFSEVLSDGTDISDPLTSVQLVASYPDFDQPTNANGTPNLVATAQGDHYTIGQTQTPPAAAAPIIWTSADSADAISASWLRLANDEPQWPAGQVQLTQTLVFDGDDPRVDLASGGVTWTSTTLTSTDLAPILVASAVGYVYVHFVLDRVLPTPNITLTVTLVLGGTPTPTPSPSPSPRPSPSPAPSPSAAPSPSISPSPTPTPTPVPTRTDTLTVTSQNQQNILWEIFSDKYFEVTSFTYSIQVEVTGPDFTDNPVIWQHAEPVQVDLPAGRIKYLNPASLTLPPCPPDQVATVNQYILAYAALGEAGGPAGTT